MASETLVPTFNFAMVCPGVYRGGYPTKKNYPFLRALQLKSILYLCPEEYAESNLKFCEQNSIHIFRFPTEGNKEPFVDIPESLMHRMLSVLVDTRNFPILIHCNKGKHRTGTVVGCLRILQGYSLLSMIAEYKQFAQEKARPVDMLFMELYHPIIKVHPPFVAPWLATGGEKSIKMVQTEEELVEEETRQLLCESLLAPTPYYTQGEQPMVYATSVTNAVATTTTAVTAVPYLPPSTASHTAHHGGAAEEEDGATGTVAPAVTPVTGNNNNTSSSKSPVKAGDGASAKKKKKDDDDDD
ncbi:Tyrosine phosphatase family, putative [Angomonas deanei]|uniref:diphosphoinositol-polyphosphate diphosphatase n=1 Tax=Angomonas deanei TaxID=59799 RepID=A0A7G2CNU0_9TRYP|nr:Tyrosine phosphatase family, putative [Angomonas deanei]